MKTTSLLFSVALGLSLFGTTQSAQAENHYSFPIQLGIQRECSLGNTIEIQIHENGTLQFKDTSYTLSKTQKYNLLKTLAQLDLATQYNTLQDIPDTAPQTQECRSIKTLSLKYKGKTLTLEHNGRKKTINTPYYRNFSRAEAALKSLSDTVFSLSLQAECSTSPYNSYQTLFELKTNGLLRTHPQHGSLGLPFTPSASQEKEYRQLLKQLSLAQTQDTPYSGPQTRECRQVKEIAYQGLLLDRNGRQFKHSTKYHALWGKFNTLLPISP